MAGQPTPELTPVRAEMRTPRKHSRPDPRPSRLMVGAGALAALSVIGAVLGRMPVIAEQSTATAVIADTASGAASADAAGTSRVKRPVRYVRLKPGQKAPRGAKVIREKAAAPRVVVHWVTPVAQTVTRAPVARTVQSGAPR
jgi:hypothetical protein